MRLVELDPQAEPYWEEMLAGEREPWGGTGEQLSWRDKTRNIGLRDDDGTLLAAGGVVLAELHTAAHPPFAVVGAGRARGPCQRARRGSRATVGDATCSSSPASSPPSGRCCSVSRA